MSTRILFHFDPTPRVRAWLASRLGAQHDLIYCAETDESRFAELLPSADAIWHVLKPITAAQIDSAPRLRLIQKIGVGVNTIAMDAARERNIAVCNMPGVNARAVAEMTLLLMLAALRRLPVLHATTQSGAWSLPPATQDTLGEIAGRTIGLVGAGNIPRLLAPTLTSLGATVIYTSRAPKPDFPGAWRAFDTLFAEADIVSLHLPATPETRDIISTRAFAAMKPGAILVNTARGELVNEPALIAALDRGHLAGAALDVFTEEPLRAPSALLNREDVITTPHVAWLTGEMWMRALTIALANVDRLARGEPFAHRVA